MDGARHQLLAGARLAIDQHRRHAAGDLVDQGAHLLHGGRLPGHAVHGLACRRRCRHRLMGQGARLAGRCCAMRGWQARWHHGRRGRRRTPQSRGHDGAELLQVHRLGEVVVGPRLQGFDRVFGRAIGGNDDRFLAPAGLFEAAQQVEPGAIGQAHVGDDGAVGAVLEVQPGIVDGPGRLDVVALAQQGQLVERAQVWFVVDDQQAEMRRGGGRHEDNCNRASAATFSGRAWRRIATENSLRLLSTALRSR